MTPTVYPTVIEQCVQFIAHKHTAQGLEFPLTDEKLYDGLLVVNRPRLKDDELTNEFNSWCATKRTEGYKHFKLQNIQSPNK